MRWQSDHIDVGVRELKAHLSDYLDRAAGGELIRVTDGGVPKAVLGPVPGAGRVEQGIAEGWIRPTALGRLDGARQVSRPVAGLGDAAVLVLAGLVRR